MKALPSGRFKMETTIRGLKEVPKQPSTAYGICVICKSTCTKKCIGNICWGCIGLVPRYIPNNQIKKYLKMKND